jgi:hypothetical protein
MAEPAGADPGFISGLEKEDVVAWTDLEFIGLCGDRTPCGFSI